MKAAHAIIAWTPMHAVGLPKCGQVLVGKWVARTAPNWALAYSNLGGATTPARRSLMEADALKALGRDYSELRADGIPADVINAAFAVIDGWLPR
jgi:AAA+ superfamily predicted ATPase